MFARQPWLLTLDGRHPFSNLSYAKAELDRRILAARKEAHGADAKPMPAWRLHDLRRSVATGMQRLGVRLEAVEAVLGHVSGSRAGIVGIYQRHSLREGGRRGAGAVGRPRDAAARSDAGQGAADAEGALMPTKVIYVATPTGEEFEPVEVGDSDAPIVWVCGGYRFPDKFDWHSAFVESGILLEDDACAEIAAAIEHLVIESRMWTSAPEAAAMRKQFEKIARNLAAMRTGIDELDEHGLAVLVGFLGEDGLAAVNAACGPLGRALAAALQRNGGLPVGEDVPSAGIVGPWSIASPQSSSVPDAKSLPHPWPFCAAGDAPA